MRILLVDDSPSTRNVFRQMLQNMGHKDIAEAADGIDAARLLEQDTIDLVISDWHIPNLDASGLLRTLRSSGNQVPVLVVISRAERCQALGALQAGANSYIIKPFDQKTLSERIQQAMANSTPPAT